MAKKVWDFKLDEKEYRVTLEHGYLSGKRKIMVEGPDIDNLPFESKQYPDYGSSYLFSFEDHTGIVVIETNGVTFTYELVIDGIAQSTGKPYISRSLSKSEIESSAGRKAAIILFTLISCILFWWNWRMALREGHYLRFLALIAPMLIVFVIYYSLVTDDETKYPKQIPFRLWAAFGVALAFGIFHLWLLDTGRFYILANLFYALLPTSTLRILFGLFVFALIVLFLWAVLRAEPKAKDDFSQKDMATSHLPGEFDPEAREKLVNKLKQDSAQKNIGNHFQSQTVSLEEFFEGNWDAYSIAANLEPHPSIEEFYNVLREIRAKPEVQDVLIAIKMVEEGNWPYSDIVLVITSASLEEIKAWFERLAPDDIDGLYSIPEMVEENMQVAYLWWD